MKKTALIIMLITIFSKLLGFAREISLSYFYGASNVSDAYLISLTIPTTIFSFIGTAISTCYIPVYNDIKKNGLIEADKFTSNLINILMLISIFFILIGLFFTGTIVRIFASGFQGETLNLAIFFTRISLFGILFSTLTYVFNSYLQVNQNFILPALVGIPFDLVAILSMALSVKYNKIILPIGSVLAIASQLVPVIPGVIKSGFKYSITFNIKDTNIKKVFSLSIPVLVGVSVNQINVLIDRTIASQISVGGISALTYANRLNWFVQGVIVMSVANVMYPTISKMVVDKNLIGLKKVLSECITAISLLVVPATVGAIIFAKPIVALLFGRGAFDAEAIEMTSNALVFYSIGMLGIGLREVLSRVFYSFQDTKTPVINAALGMLLNIILNIVLSKYLGISGLAFATSIAAIFTTGLLMIKLKKKIVSFGIKKLTISFAKIAIASIIMGVVTKLCFNYIVLFLTQNIALLTVMIFGMLLYMFLIYFMKIDDVDVVIAIIKNKVNELGKDRSIK